MTNAQQNTWFAIGGSTSLSRIEVQPVYLFGVERVAWRDENGQSHVWHNRCIHRGMRLNYGFVDGNRLACRYHGWRFGGDGKCAHIPAHPEMTPPGDFCIPASPSEEASGLIWTSLGLPKGPPPDLSSYANLTFCRTVTIQCSAAEIKTGFDDMSFPIFSQEGSVAHISGREIAPSIVAIDANVGETLILAVQPMNDTKTNLHVLVDANCGDDDQSGLRLHYSAWARRFRWQIENPMPDTRLV